MQITQPGFGIQIEQPTRYSIKQAAQFLDISVPTLRALNIPFYKISERNTFYRLEDLVRYLETCRVEREDDE